MSRLRSSVTALFVALPLGGVAAAQGFEPASAIYVSMCSEEVLAGRCLDSTGERLDTELTALAPDGSVRHT